VIYSRLVLQACAADSPLAAMACNWGTMALFAVLIVGMVLAQSWCDWRDTHHRSALPRWGGGLALGGFIAGAFSAAIPLAISLFGQKSAGELTGRSGSGLFWLQLVFVLAAMSIVVFAVRRKRPRILVALAFLLLIVLCVSLAWLA
jgi:hypothetical protein